MERLDVGGYAGGVRTCHGSARHDCVANMTVIVLNACQCGMRCESSQNIEPRCDKIRLPPFRISCIGKIYQL